MTNYIRRFQAGGAADDPIVGQQTGTESSLSNWAGDYVTNMLGKGQALANQPYQAYTGPLSAGQSTAQQAAFQGVGNLSVPTGQMGAAGFQPQKFTAQAAQDYMNPYMQAALDPQIEEARRQAQITRLGDANRLTQAGAYGGSRQAIMESELNRSLGQNLANITGQGYQSAYDKAMQQFNTEQQAQSQAQNLTNQYGLQALQNQASLGAQERAIQSEGIAADIAQFEEERDFPYKQTQYQQSLLQGLPLAAQSYSYAKPSQLSELLGGSGGLMGLLQSFGIIPSDVEEGTP
tara:strand:+ start:1192 stop:2064 length:873 start_codon:yes stop_codon:yes gene_type:complete